MASHAVLTAELERAIRHGSTTKRADMAERVTDLFVAAADRFAIAEVALFDEILLRLIEEIEVAIRAGVARRLAPIASAPAGVVRRLAGDVEIAVAGPLLRQSPRLDEADLAALAGRLGMAHLTAISQRSVIPPSVADILVARGDSETLLVLAANWGARFSIHGYEVLIERAAPEDRLAETVGRRRDISAGHLHRLVRAASDVVRRRLMAAAREGEDGRPAPARLSAPAGLGGAWIAAAIYRDAQRTVMALVHAGTLDEDRLRDFAANRQFEESVATISALSRIPIDVVERLVHGRLDSILVLGRAIGIGWRTVEALLDFRNPLPAGWDAETARVNFERLSPASAERVVRFWRDGGLAAPAKRP